MSTPKVKKAPPLLEEFLKLTEEADMNGPAAGALVGVNKARISQWRAGIYPERLQTKTRESMERAVAHLRAKRGRSGSSETLNNVSRETLASEIKSFAQHAMWLGGKLDLLAEQIEGDARKQRGFIRQLGEAAERELREQQRDFKVAPYVKVPEPSSTTSRGKGRTHRRAGGAR